jgi:hypothetical protein
MIPISEGHRELAWNVSDVPSGDQSIYNKARQELQPKDLKVAHKLPPHER